MSELINNKILIIKGILAYARMHFEKCGLNTDLYEELSELLDDIKILSDAKNSALKGFKELNEAIFDVSNRRKLFDKFYAWLDGLTQEEYDNMSLTDKCEKFFFKT